MTLPGAGAAATPPHANRATATIAVLVTSVLWGTTGFSAVFAAPLQPITIGAAVMGIAGLVLAVMHRRAIPGVLRAPGALRITLGGAASIATFTLCYYASLGFAGVAIGTIVTICSSPVFAGLIELVIDRSPLTIRWYIAALLAIFGGVLLVTGRGAGGSWLGADPATLPWGVALGLVAGFAYALYAWLLARLIRPTPLRPDGVNRSVAVATIQSLAAGPLLVFMLASGGSLLLEWSVWPALLYVGLIPMALGHTLFGWSLAALSASTVTLYTLLEPVVATLLAVGLLGETLTIGGWAGLALVLSGIAVLSVPRTRNR